MKLKDRVAVITGAGSGIGRASALEFARAGARVVVADINLPGAQETVRQVEGLGGQSVPVQTDVSDPASVQNLVTAALDAYGQVHVLFNNAAIMVSKTVEDTSVEEWNRLIAVNLGGVFLCAKFFLPHLRRTRGTIISTSSVNGYFVEPGCAAYCATKAGIIALTRALAIDHGKEGIRANSICPGYIDTPLGESYYLSQPDPEAARAAAGRLHALWRTGKPEEVARLAVFLASDEASFITGSAMPVDGGFGSGLPPQS